jgi:hypothetical protein
MAFNIGQQDSQLTLSQALPAANASVTTGILDLQAIAPRSNAWSLGLLAVTVPALPENNTGAGITIALQAAAPSLTVGSGAIAPNLPSPGTFAAPACAQTITIPAVTNGGSLAQTYYFTAALDANGSTYQFYQFVITVPTGVNTTGEIVTIGWINA